MDREERKHITRLVNSLPDLHRQIPKDFKDFSRAEAIAEFGPGDYGDENRIPVSYEKHTKPRQMIRDEIYAIFKKYDDLSRAKVIKKQFLEKVEQFDLVKFRKFKKRQIELNLDLRRRELIYYTQKHRRVYQELFLGHPEHYLFESRDTYFKTGEGLQNYVLDAVEFASLNFAQ